MAFMHAQVILFHSSGAPEAHFVNNFYFQTTDSHGGPYNATPQINAGLLSCYNQFGSVITQAISRGNSHVKYYDLEYAPPNPPQVQLPFEFATNGAAVWNLPQEVAMTGSFYSAMPAGAIPARRRGRVYFGPWGYQTGQDFLHPPTAFRTAINAGLNALLQASNTEASWSWITFSRADAGGFLLPGGSGTPNFAQGAHPVIGGWVDDEWDTQRRRGVDATTRSVFGVDPNRRFLNEDGSPAVQGTKRNS